MQEFSVQDKNPVTQVLRNAEPELQGFCPVPRQEFYTKDVGYAAG